MNISHIAPSERSWLTLALSCVFFSLFNLKPLYASHEITITSQSKITIDGSHIDNDGNQWLTGRLYDLHNHSGLAEKNLEFLFYSNAKEKPIPKKTTTSKQGGFEIITPKTSLERVVVFFRNEKFYSPSTLTFVFPKPPQPSLSPKTSSPVASHKNQLVFLGATSLVVLSLFLISVLKNSRLPSQTQQKNKDALKTPYSLLKAKELDDDDSPLSVLKTPRLLLEVTCKYSKRPLSGVRISTHQDNNKNPMSLKTDLKGQCTLNPVPKMPFVFTIDKKGYEPKTQECSLENIGALRSKTKTINIEMVSYKLEAMSLYLNLLEKNNLPKTKTPLQIQTMKAQSELIKSASSAIEDIAFGPQETSFEEMTSFKETLA